MTDHTHPHTQDWLHTVRANNDWMARAIVVLAPRQHVSTMSRRARKALARARKRTRRGSK